MRSFWSLALLVAAAALAQDHQPGQGVNFYTKEKEIALGQSLAAEVRRTTTPLDDVPATDYVKRVGANLAAQFPGNWTYQFELIQDDSPDGTHEPLALPGGIIFVSQHLIGAAQNEAEFAGMLAHAMAHVVARHWTRQATKGELMQIGALANTIPQPMGPPVPLGMLAFRRAAEREADFLAIRAMAAAQYDPEALASYIQRVQVLPAGSISKVFSIYPDREERVAAIRKEIQLLK
jgi:predicted Zn-dependent protease